MTRFPFDTEIERGDDLIELRVIYSVSKFYEATRWQPAEGGEVEIISVTHKGKPFDLTDAEESLLLTECEERVEQDMLDEQAARDDWKYQEYRDRLLMRQWEGDQ